MANTDIKGVIFDYGGTIDSRGDHWSEVIWDGYREADVQVTKEQFRDCYVYAERELAKTRHILPEHNFYDLLLIKMRIEIGNLVENAVLPSDYPVEEKALAVARYCYNRAKESVEEARQVLDFVHERVPMVLVSNFYGNVETVLADFDLARYFKKVVESALGGVLFIDEFDSSLHPLIVENIIRLFNDKRFNRNNAQLIVSCQSVSLMTNKLFRRDQIWLCEKDRYGASEIYSLMDFEDLVRKDANFNKNYLAGKYGAVPNIDVIRLQMEK